MKESLIYKSDGYKYTHWGVYPEGTQYIQSYLESRGGMFDSVMWNGLQPILKEHLVGDVITADDIKDAQPFMTQYLGGPQIFNAQGWERMLSRYGGKLPMSICSAPEGSTIPVSNVLMTMLNTDSEFPWLTNFLESLLLHVWFPTTVGTLSREIKKVCKEYLLMTGCNLEGLPFMLNDFGFRGVSSVESAQIGGTAHLINFMGTDNTPAVRYAMKMYGADVCGFTAVATEHSVMTIKGRAGEVTQLDRLLDVHETGLVACVGDSYNMMEFVSTHLAARKDRILARDGKFVCRPDSGDPVKMSVDVMNRLGAVFGYTENDAGYKVLPPQVGMIYGDGINYESIRQILEALMAAGWAASNIVFGMGGGLLQQLDRDTQEFAIKAWEAIIDDECFEVFKDPITSSGKRSKAGAHKLVKKMGTFEYTTVPISAEGEDVLIQVFCNGELLVDVPYEDVRKHAEV